MSAKFSGNFLVAVLIGALILPSFGFAQSQEGGSDTGGGNICTLKGKPVLLELAEDSENLNLRGMKLKQTKLMKVMGIDLLPSFANTPAGIRAVQLLERAKAVSPKSVELIKQSILHIDFHGTMISPNYPLRADFSGQTLCDSTKTVAAVIYIRSGLALISVPLFNKLDLDSQAALLIHETLRRIQITYEGDGNDFELQRITKSIVFNSPENLDNNEFFGAFFAGKYNAVRVWRKSCADLKEFALQSPAYKSKIDIVCPVQLDAHAEKGRLNGAYDLLEALFAVLPKEEVDADNPIAKAFRAVGYLILPPNPEDLMPGEIMVRDLSQLTRTLTAGMEFASFADIVEGRTNHTAAERKLLMDKLGEFKATILKFEKK